MHLPILNIIQLNKHMSENSKNQQSKSTLVYCETHKLSVQLTHYETVYKTM